MDASPGRTAQAAARDGDPAAVRARLLDHERPVEPRRRRVDAEARRRSDARAGAASRPSTLTRRGGARARRRQLDRGLRRHLAQASASVAHRAVDARSAGNLDTQVAVVDRRVDDARGRGGNARAFGDAVDDAAREAGPGCGGRTSRARARAPSARRRRSCSWRSSPRCERCACRGRTRRLRRPAVSPPLRRSGRRSVVPRGRLGHARDRRRRLPSGRVMRSEASSGPAWPSSRASGRSRRAVAPARPAGTSCRVYGWSAITPRLLRARASVRCRHVGARRAGLLPAITNVSTRWPASSALMSKRQTLAAPSAQTASPGVPRRQVRGAADRARAARARRRPRAPRARAARPGRSGRRDRCSSVPVTSVTSTIETR